MHRAPSSECKLNTVLSCAMALYPSMEQWFPFTRCVEGSSAQAVLESLGKCARDAAMDFRTIQACVGGVSHVPRLHCAPVSLASPARRAQHRE